MRSHVWLVGLLEDLEKYAAVNGLKSLAVYFSEGFDIALSDIDECEAQSNIVDLEQYRSQKCLPLAAGARTDYDTSIILKYFDEIESIRK